MFAHTPRHEDRNGGNWVTWMFYLTPKNRYIQQILYVYYRKNKEPQNTDHSTLIKSSIIYLLYIVATAPVLNSNPHIHGVLCLQLTPARGM